MRATVRHIGLVFTLLSLGCSDRVAGDLIDRDELMRDACEQQCEMFEACGVDLSWSYEIWPEPESCVDRCLTLNPRLHKDNQCGSREILAIQCIGELDCEGYAAFYAGQGSLDHPPDWSAPCVIESQGGCSPSEPFDLDETIPVPNWP